ncbi:MAG TPA: rhodanese-like domain-containing protein [Candidatus Dormibacteraeota bacterium]
MGVKEMVAAARARVRAVTKEELEQELRNGDVQLLDVRDVRERWRLGTIPGARSVPRGMLEFWADPDSPYYKEGLDPAKRTIVYCAGGMRSALAADALQQLGYKDVAHLEIGFDGWKQAGGEVEKVEVPAEIKNG